MELHGCCSIPNGLAALDATCAGGYTQRHGLGGQSCHASCSQRHVPQTLTIGPCVFPIAGGFLNPNAMQEQVCSSTQPAPLAGACMMCTALVALPCAAPPDCAVTLAAPFGQPQWSLLSGAQPMGGFAFGGVQAVQQQQQLQPVAFGAIAAQAQQEQNAMES